MGGIAHEEVKPEVKPEETETKQPEKPLEKTPTGNKAVFGDTKDGV